MSKTASLSTSPTCIHAHCKSPEGLCVVTVGNSLRSDDGIASELCDTLPSSLLTQVCRFDLGTHTGYLADCLLGHKVAIIIDCTRNGTEPGTVTILDLSSVVNRSAKADIASCHSFSFLDELLLAAKQQQLPERMVFFGVEASNVDWSEKLSSEMKKTFPLLMSRLSFLISVLLEALKKDA